MNAMEMNQMIETILEMMVDPETGVVLEEEEAIALADKFECDKMQKVEWMLKHIANEKYKVEAMTNHKRELGNMIKTKENIIDRFSKYVALVLNYEKYETADGLAKISYRTTKDKVTIDDINEIPLEYFKTPRYESNLSKTQIKEMIQSGSPVPGVHLEDSKSIIVKG